MKTIRKFFIPLVLCLSMLFPFSVLAEKEHLKFTRKAAAYTPELGSDTVSYLNTPKLIEYFRTYSPHGLSFQSLWVVANVMDEAGTKYNLMREYKTTDTTMTLASVEVPGLHATAKPLFKPGDMFHGRILHELDEENGLIFVRPFLPGKAAFSIIIRPQQILWKDAGDRIDLTFNALGPALQYYTPGRPEDAMYRSEPCYVEGTVDGKKVSGFGVIDNAWGSTGVGFIQGKIYRLLEEYWIVWLNIFEDGSKECGVFIDGIDRFEAFYYNRNGKARVTRHNTLVPDYTDDGFMKSATITMDDLTFEFTTESRIMQVQSHVSWASGRVLNNKDSRKPVKSFAWFEFFPKSKKGDGP
jgi:hypothetical protein